MMIIMQVHYENDPEAAIVQFSSPAEAKAGHDCAEAVLNNRFIKVYYLKGGCTANRAQQQLGMGQIELVSTVSKNSDTVEYYIYVVKQAFYLLVCYASDQGLWPLQ